MSEPKHLLHRVVEEVCSSWPPLTISFSIEKGDVKNAFLQGTIDDKTHGDLAEEPVPELRKALNLREDEIVMLTKACYGLIDAPRRRWKSLFRDTQQLGWHSCRPGTFVENSKGPCVFTLTMS